MDKIKEIIDRVFKSEQEKRLMGAAVLVLIGLCIFIMAISPLVGASPIITLNGEEEMLVECGSEFVDPGVKATAKDEDISDLVMTTGNVDTSKLGTYHVEYQLKYKKRKVSKERIVKVIDHAAPVIALNGDATVIVGSFEEYQEAGATAQDGCDGDVSKDIKITKEKVNDYTMQVHYEVTDSHGNTGSMDRQIILKDTSAPEITLNGESSVTVKELEKYEDAGATATDDRDGDITANLVKSGYFDVYRPVTYTVTYTATDSSGNVSQATRTVKVEEVETNPGDSIYLTFDDGPSSDVTVRVLDTLKANGIKATFFICDYDEDKLPSDCIKCLTPKEAQTKNAEDKDHEHIYVYPVKYYKDYNGNVYKEYQLNGKFEIATNTNEAKQIASTGKVPVYRIPAVPIDYITSYRFYRKIGERNMVATGEFTYKDAIVAGCFEKDTYKKYPKIMISHRAFVYGAREIANDLIMGCLSTEELKTMQGIDLSNEDIIDITEIQ